MSTETVRLFLALELPTSLKDHLAKLINDLSGSVHRDTANSANTDNTVKWVKPEHMHLTLKFFGETDPARVSELVFAINKVIAHPEHDKALELQSSKLGAFPNFRRASVFWANLEGAELEALTALVDSLEEGFVVAGFAPEKKRFRAHLTLGRVRVKADASAITRTVEEYPYQSIATSFSELALFKSELTPSGPVHTVLEKWSLGVERFGE